MSWNVTMLESLVQKVQESKNKEFEVAALLDLLRKSDLEKWAWERKGVKRH